MARPTKPRNIIPLPKLRAMIEQLEQAHGVERVRLARALSPLDGPTLASIQAAGDEGIVQAKAELKLSDAALARELGYATRSAVTDAVRRHKDRFAGQR